VSRAGRRRADAGRPSSPAPLRLRRATPADDRACAALMRAAIGGLLRRRPRLHRAGELAAWASLPPLYHRWAMGPGEEAYVLAEAGGRALGYAARRGAEVTAVFVRPRAQGGGVGRAPVEALCADAAREGRRAVRVLGAHAALPFYAALGFTGRRAVAVPLPGGLALDAVRLAKRLPRASAGPRGGGPLAVSLPGHVAGERLTASRTAGGRRSAGSRRRGGGAGRRPRRPGSAPGRRARRASRRWTRASPPGRR
jgi:GNAT superfamily N-acetyltransferase